jgi:hypothetical protein
MNSRAAGGVIRLSLPPGGLSIVEEAIKQAQDVLGIAAPEVSEVNVGGPTDHEAGTPYIWKRQGQTASSRVPFRARADIVRPTGPCRSPDGAGLLEADARTRTGDPFITSELSRTGGV